VAGWLELGHYIPELAKAIVDGNKEASSLKINLRGFMVSTTHTHSGFRYSTQVLIFPLSFTPDCATADSCDLSPGFLRLASKLH
jgi:hypothetical protein